MDHQRSSASPPPLHATVVAVATAAAGTSLVICIRDVLTSAAVSVTNIPGDRASKKLFVLIKQVAQL